MNKINPLNPLLSKIARFEQVDTHGKQWESSRVEWTLRRLKLDGKRKEILENGLGLGYTFEVFNQVVNFPMYLFAEPLLNVSPIHRDPRTIHPLWFKAFRGLPFVERYEERMEPLLTRYPDRPIGMVFPRKGFLQGLLIHNGDWDLLTPPQASCHVFKGGRKKAMNLIVQPYSGFVDHVRDVLAWKD